MATCPSQDLNFLSPVGFRFQVTRMPDVAFFTNTVQLPSVQLADVGLPTPLSRIAVPADQLDFNPLAISFIVDESMDNYISAFNWMKGLGFPENYEQYTTENQSQGYPDSSESSKNLSDIKLFVLDSNYNTTRTFTFVDCFPTSLDGISFGSNQMDVEYVTSQLTFNYSYFTLE